MCCQRIMTDNIFEIETAAIALPTCYPEEPGILLTDFSYANPSEDHRWIFMVLERAGISQTLQRFLRGICAGSVTSVEHSCVARAKFAMMRGVSQRCPASGYLFTVASDPVFRRLMTEPHRRWYLQRTECAYAHDVALANASLRETLPSVAGAFATIDLVTGMSLTHPCGGMDQRPRPSVSANAGYRLRQILGCDEWGRRSYSQVDKSKQQICWCVCPHSLVLAQLCSKTCLVQHSRPFRP